MASNSAILVRLYPKARQEKLLNDCCLYRWHYYNGLALWWNTMKRICNQKYADFCKIEEDESARKEFSKSLLWPPKKVSKEGLNDTCLKIYFDKMPCFMKSSCVENFIDRPKKGKEKGIDKNYGSIFRLNATYLPSVYGVCPASSSVAAWCKDDFARAINMTFDQKRIEQKKKNCVAKGKSFQYPNYIHRQDFTQATTFKISITKFDVKYNSKGKVCAIHIPFLSGDRRKREGDSIEWVDCSLSDSLLDKAQSVSAITVTKAPTGKWFCSLSVYRDTPERENTGLECGVDIGIKTTATIAYNITNTQDVKEDVFEKLSLPVNKIKSLEKRIEYLQKAQSRRIKTWVRLNKDGDAKGLSLNTKAGDNAHNATILYRKKFQSNAYKTTEHRIALLHQKISNIRKDFAEKTSRDLANRFDYIGLEDLNVSGMVKNKKLARHIERIGFYNLRICIQRKVGIDRVSYLNRFAPSSKVCSVCGYKKTDMTLKDREWICPECGTHHDRDENAASNIRPSRKKLLEKFLLKE